MARKSRTRTSRRLTGALGRGLVAGVVGTAAMTISSTAEAKLTGRGASTTPADAAGKVVGVMPRDEAGEQRFNTMAHWGYGTAWGIFRGALGVIGLRGPAASLVHLIAVLGTEQALLPALGVAAPTPSYGAKATATDTLHHLVYAGVSGLAYDNL
jgi:hypothetical protein